jgi:hypothetical protein
MAEEHHPVEDVRVQPPPSYQEYVSQVGSTFHVSLPAGPVVLLLLSAVPAGDIPREQNITLTWRGPRQPRLPDTAVLYHSILPPLTVTWLNARIEPKHILYSTVVTT